MEVTCELEPLTQGRWSSLEVVVTNTSPGEVLVLEAVAWEGEGVRGRHEWERPQAGSLRYEAQDDLYRLETAVSIAAPLPLQVGVLLPGARARTLVPIQALGCGPCALKLVGRGVRFPLSEFAERVYQLDPATASQPTQRFSRGPLDHDQAVRDAFVRRRGCAAVEATRELSLEVNACDQDPSAAVLRRVPGELVGRVRRLGGAWLVREALGSLALVRGERCLRFPPSCLDPATLLALDADPPFLPVVLLFRGKTACALRDSGDLALDGLELGQQLLAAAELWSLIERAHELGLALRWGAHAPLAEGLIVSG